jgi:hypothetical protein
MKWLCHTEYPRGGLGCVASKGLAGAPSWICGNRRTYGQDFGSVANKGVRGPGAGKAVEPFGTQGKQAGNTRRNESASVAANYQE